MQIIPALRKQLHPWETSHVAACDVAYVPLMEVQTSVTAKGKQKNKKEKKKRS